MKQEKGRPIYFRLNEVIIIVLILLSLFPDKSIGQIKFETPNIRIGIDRNGTIKELVNVLSRLNYLSKDTSSYFLSVISAGEILRPLDVKYELKTSSIYFSFNRPIAIVVKIAEKKKYLTFEVIKAEPASMVDAVIWGPIFTTLSDQVGEVVGVVRDKNVSVGLQLLNAKTLGGNFDKNGIFEARGSLALQNRHGSNLQAYSLNRDKQRYVDAMGHKNIPVKPIIGETVMGSKIAVFSCLTSETMGIIENIVSDEGLPYPKRNGIWTKKAFLESSSYLISDFKESEIDKVIEYAKRGGFFSVYHEGPFKTWGHFELDTAYFPTGELGLKECAVKARAVGLNFGVHVLTNFITPNDPYITPSPDNRLAYTGYGFLNSNIPIDATEIEISTKEYFEDMKNNNMHTVMVGKELIKYKDVTKDEPYKLIDCQRGAFGTRAEEHFKNDTIKKLIDHAYNVFFPNIQMQREIAINLAKLFNRTGVNHLDFDGHEGCYASGEGDYAYCLFAEDFYKTIDHEFVNGTSNSKPYYWYINTLCNWGEPWYGGFKESMQDYRISNQSMLERNYQPNMLGWYMLTKNTTLPEMEWMLARAAGWNAGFAMVIRVKAIESNPSGVMLLDAIKEWETARLTHAFNSEQRVLLKNPKNEFHLEKIKENEWDLYQIESANPFIYEKMDRQPGEPNSSIFKYFQKGLAQKLRFNVEVSGSSGFIKNLRINIDNYFEVIIPAEVRNGETIICDGSNIIRFYDEKGKMKSSFDFTGKIPTLDTGEHKVAVDADLETDDQLVLMCTLKWMNNPIRVKGIVEK